MSDTPDRRPDSTHTVELRVPGMDCPSCAGKVTKGIESVEARVTSGRLVVEYDPTETDSDAIRERVRAAGYAIESEGGELSLSVPGMDCASCAIKVQNALRATDGVGGVETQPASGRLTVSVVEGIDREDVVAAVESAGYEARVEGEDDTLPEECAVRKSRRAVGTAVGALLVTVG